MRKTRCTLPLRPPLAALAPLLTLLSAAPLGASAANDPQPLPGGLPPLSASVASDEDEIDGILVTPEQMAAVDRGLAYLASIQDESGSWTADIGYKLNNGYRETASRGHVGVTALAGMAFLAGGHLPGRGEWGSNTERCLEFVLSCVQDDGYITYAGSRMYSHAFATLFLAEIYGMTHREDVKDKLQSAVDFIVTSQNSQGGWRYEPYATGSDMSIVVCQVLAMRAARNIGIRVPKSVIDKAAQYVVDSAVTERTITPAWGRRMNYASEVGSFHYQKQDGSRSSFALTAAGVTALYGSGIYSDESIRNGLDYLMRKLDDFSRDWGTGPRYKGHYFFWYGHYYGVQAMYTAGGDFWKVYFERAREDLLSLQHPSGKWPNDVGPGTAFSTATAILILEIPYRFLPIFQR